VQIYFVLLLLEGGGEFLDPGRFFIPGCDKVKFDVNTTRNNHLNCWRLEFVSEYIRSVPSTRWRDLPLGS